MKITQVIVKKMSHKQGRNKLYFTKLKVRVGRAATVATMIKAVEEYVINKLHMYEIVPKTLAYRLLPTTKIRFMFMCMCRPTAPKKGKK